MSLNWSNENIFFMEKALFLAEQGACENEVPVGAVVVYENRIIGEGFNSPITKCDPSAHAEILAIRNACAYLKNYRLTGCDLYVTLEPCTMCVGAIVHSRIDNLYYGATEPKSGVVESQNQLLSASYLNHKVNIHKGLLSESSSRILQSFFANKRKLKKRKL